MSHAGMRPPTADTLADSMADSMAGSGAGSGADTAADTLAEALDWQVTLWSGEVSQAEHEAFQRWLSADPRHQQAWNRLQLTDDRLRTLNRPAAAVALRSEAQAGSTLRRPGGSRRRALGLAAALAGGGLAFAAVRQTPQWQRIRAEAATGIGERRDLILPDSGRVTLGSASAIDIDYTGQWRRIHLLAGEISITTAPDPTRGLARPFVVETAEGRVRALGTRFQIRHAGALTLVSVEAGAVEIRPIDAPDSGVVAIEAGQQTRFSRSAVENSRPLAPEASAWTRGLLVAERMRLDDFLAELSRYRPGVLRSTPEVRGLIVSGVYSLDDTDRALAALMKALPLRLRTATRYWVTVTSAE